MLLILIILKIWISLESRRKTKKQSLVKTIKENGNGELYLEFTKDELHILDLEKGDSVEWMQLEDGEVWKKVNKMKWSI